jgi:uncharacterized membrane protein
MPKTLPSNLLWQLPIFCLFLGSVVSIARQVSEQNHQKTLSAEDDTAQQIADLQAMVRTLQDDVGGLKAVRTVLIVLVSIIFFIVLAIPVLLCFIYKCIAGAFNPTY